MLRLMLTLLAFLYGMLPLRPDDTPEDDADDDDGTPSGDDASNMTEAEAIAFLQANNHDVIVLKTEDDKERFFDKNFRKRHRRMKEDAKREARDELRDEIQAEHAADKTRAEQAVRDRNEKITNLEARIEELEDEVEARDELVSTAKKDTKRYATAIEKRWDEVKDRVPEHVLELIEDRDVLYRVSYVEKHADILEATDDEIDPLDDDSGVPPDTIVAPDDITTTERGRVRGAPRTPAPANRRKRQQELDDAAAEESRTHVRQAL